MTKLTVTHSIILLSLIASCQSMTNSKAEKSADNSQNQVVSTFKGGEITLKEVDYELKKLVAKNNKLKDLTFDKLSAEQKDALVKEVVLKEIADKEARKRNLHKDPDYKEAVQLFEGDLLKQKLLIALIQEAQDDKNVRKNYDELVEKLKNKKDYKVSYIALKTQKEAEAVYKTLVKSPNSFAMQARKKSVDKEIAKKDGALGFVIEDSLPAEVIKEIKSLKKGEISKPFATSSKWVIVKFEDERAAEILPYEKAKAALAQNLAKKALEDFIKQSLENAKIEMVKK